MPNTQSCTVSSSDQQETPGRAPAPVLVVNALALGQGGKPDGYQTAVYYLPSAQRDNVEFIVSQVGQEANWKMCGDAHLDKVEESAKVATLQSSSKKYIDATLTCNPERKSDIAPGFALCNVNVLYHDPLQCDSNHSPVV